MLNKVIKNILLCVYDESVRRALHMEKRVTSNTYISILSSLLSMKKSKMKGVIKMAGPKVKEKESNVKKQVNHEEETSLKGTLASVMILGGIIVLSWIGVWMLFVTR